MLTRRQKLLLNTGTALVYQIVALICGFILPKQILLYFGSDVNGLVSSISRFLSVIVFMEMGVGPVIQSNLYKPLAEKDNDTISKIVVSAERFYKRIAYIFLVYIVILTIYFPRINGDFDYWFTASLIIIISISTFAQYYFGITYQVFLNADQKSYVQTSLQLLSVVLNTIVCLVMMKLGSSLHLMKLASAGVYVIRPIVQNIYVNRKYQINHSIQFEGEPIQQKWNGFAQHLTSVVSGVVDVVLLTLFSTYQNVSIYSVYFLVVNGITNMFMVAVSGLEALFGNMLVKKEHKLLLSTFEGVESVMHAAVTIIYVATAILIAPFVSVYINGISDANAYYLPVFGALLTCAYAAQCLRIPYFRMVKAAGHYKQTQLGSFIAMMINIVVSVILVFRYGLIGVAGGTIVAMFFYTLYVAWYLRKNIINRPFNHIVKHFVVDVIVAVLSYFATGWLTLGEVSYLAWVIYALFVTLIVAAIGLSINMVIYKKEFLFVIRKMLKRK